MQNLTLSLADADAAITIDSNPNPDISDTDLLRAGLVTAYVRARGVRDVKAKSRLQAEAADYDRAHPDEQPLVDELHAIESFGAPVLTETDWFFVGEARAALAASKASGGSGVQAVRKNVARLEAAVAGLLYVVDDGSEVA
ncbi:hypothetical protein [Streptomyces sp. CBMA152]|uniref:hypothetical protein n=1 Tax=Streptomyces sp. CBMA152 TaxID=1896312 RepID=UPI0016609C54|nr:hypothetical protein [Streptomyces sp. CBMA152]MBD0743550.1 hypothetical protein [Streptomyces sp. CBMA152]